MGKRIIVSTVFAIAILTSTCAQAAFDLTFSGPINANTTWSGNVRITGDVTVNSGATLTISPGTTVNFDFNSDDQVGGSNTSRCELIINGGTLNASGTSGSPILFTSGPDPLRTKVKGDWYGISVVSGGNITMIFCTVEYANTGLKLTSVSTTKVFQDSTFQQSTTFGMDCAITATATRCTFQQNATGVNIQGGATVTFNNCSAIKNVTDGIDCAGSAALTATVVNNNGQTGIYSGTAGANLNAARCSFCYNRFGIDFGGGGQVVGTVTVSDCTICNNTTRGLDTNFSASSNISITSCSVSNNGGFGIYSGGAGATISKCYVSSNTGTGIYTAAKTSNCTIIGNGSGTSDYGVILDCTNTTFSNNIVNANRSGVQIGAFSVLNAFTLQSGNDIYSNTTYEIANNISNAVTATGNYFGDPTLSELNNAQLNLSKIYDSHDNATIGQVIISSPYVATNQVVMVSTNTPLATVGINSTYSVTLAAVNGTAPYTWSLDSGALPSGIALSSGGVVSGTPTIADTYSFTVKVTDTNGHAGYKRFELLVSSVPAPTITSLSPATGSTAGGTSVTLTGANYASGASVTFGAAAATNVSVVSATQITCLAPAHAAGVVDVTVTVNGISNSLLGGFTYDAPPVISSLSPSSGPAAGATSVTLTGTTFVAGATVSFGGTAAANITVVSATSITCTTPAHAAGQADVVVTNPDGVSGTKTNAFTYNLPPTPTLTSLSPVSGSIAGGTSVTLTGTNFAAGAAVTFGGTAATNVTVGSATSITCTTPQGAAGAVDVAVSFGGVGVTKTGGYTYNAPAIASLSPVGGPLAGATAVTIAGSDFAAGATVTFGAVAATNVTVASAASITCTTPAHAAGAVDVVLTLAGVSVTKSGAYTYIDVPLVNSPTSASGVVGASFSFQISGSNSPTSFDASGLPAGLAVDKTKGLITGTPTAAGSSNVTVTASNTAGSGTATLTIGIAGQAPAISSPLSATAVAGQPFSYGISANGITPITFSASPLPDGLSLSGATLSGTPTTTGVTNVALTATNAAGSDSKTLVLTVNPAGSPLISSANSAGGSVGSAFSFTLVASGTAPVSFTATNLPPGLSLSGAAISGTPSAIGTTVVSIAATNAVGSDTESLTITVTAKGSPAVTSALTATATANGAFTYAITATGAGTIAFSATNLPSWLTLSGATLSGTPPANAVGVTKVTLTATNSVGSDSKDISLTVTTQFPPVILGIVPSRNPVRTGVVVAFSANVNNTNNLPLTYNWNFGDGSLGSGASVTHTYGAENQFVLQLIVNDGFQNANFSLTLETLAPNAAGASILNVTDGKPDVVNPNGGLTLHVPGSAGGVCDLDIVESLTGRSIGNIATIIPTRTGKLGGTAIAGKFTKSGIYVVESSESDDQGNTLRNVRRMLPVSGREIGEALSIADARSSTGVDAATVKGKVLFSGQKFDLITLTGTLELPGGFDVSQQHDVVVGFGNIVETVTVSVRGQGGPTGKVKKLTIKYPKVDKTLHLTKQGDKAKITLVISGTSLHTAGLDTEGIVNTGLSNGVPVSRQIQAAIVIGGVSYFTPISVMYTLKNGTGTIRNH